ncbi:abortive infection family protein [Candidatus Peregrinibacteria bacterium]|nr:MAG: abortive infection family protein [Candidatus Peregrinibacteria bacterium]
MKLVAKELKITPEDISEKVRGEETIKRLLSNLSTVVNGISELRNLYGSGHGKKKHYTSLEPRHARLAVGASSVLATFIIETYEKHKNKKQ